MADIVVYLNGQFVPYGEAKVGIEDRGYQFGDGIYEVFRVYDGKPFRMKEHFERLQRSAREIELPDPGIEKLSAAALELMKLNNSFNAAVYVQMTRGDSPRKHLPPTGLQPVIVMTARELTASSAEMRSNGVKAITISDDRWSKCYIKTINLLPNCLGKLKASRAGAFEAIYIRDGFVTDCTSSNAAIVEKGTFITPPLSNYILGGITRAFALELCRSLGIPAKEEPVSEQRLESADEVMVTGTVSEIMPVVNLNGATVSGGKPGPVFSKLYQKFSAVVTGKETL